MNRIADDERPATAATVAPVPRHRLMAYYRGSQRAIPVEDIIYLRAGDKYVTVRHTGGELLVDESLRALEREFPERFVRIHRNALVARDRLHGLETVAGGLAVVRLHDCDERLPVSRSHLRRLRNLD